MTQTTEVATQGNTLLRTLNSDATKNSLRMALPSGGLTPERLVRIVMTECRKVPKLLECTEESFLGAVLKAASMGLEIGVLGQASIVPFRDNRKNVTECTLIVGYQGHLTLLYNTGEVGSVSAELIYKEDEFEYGLGEVPFLTHKPPALGSNEYDKRSKDSVIGAYCVIALKGGQRFFTVMSEQEILKHKARSKTPKIWEHPDDWQWMWKKTLIIQCSKLAPKSVTNHVQGAQLAEFDTGSLMNEFGEDIDEITKTPIDVTDTTDKEPGSEPETTIPPETENAERDEPKPPRKDDVTPGNAHLQR